MKKILLTSALLSLAGVAFPQGSITFDNRTADNNAPIYNFNPNNPTEQLKGNTATGVPMGTSIYAGALLNGPGFTATLWAIESSQATGVADMGQNNLSLIGTTTFSTRNTISSFQGRVAPSAANPQVPGVTTTALRGTFQLRVWNNQGGTITDWQHALLAFSAGQTAIGLSDLFTVGSSLGDLVPPGGGTPTQPPNLLGLRSFELFNVPEPSVIALGVLGAGCLFLLRRRK